MLTAILGIITPVIGKVLDFIPNPVEKEKARLAMEEEMAKQQLEIAKILAQADTNQTDVNKVEASSMSIFVSGWRPFVGWVSGFGVAWSFVFKPILDWFLAVIHHPTLTPALDISQLMTLLLGMLGMGALRSMDKKNGVASK
jgi:hypothetical protein